MNIHVAKYERIYTYSFIGHYDTYIFLNYTLNRIPSLSDEMDVYFLQSWQYACIAYCQKS